MTVYKKNNAVGLDKLINRMIDKLNTELNVNNNWGLVIYHKVYRNIKDGKTVPEVHTGGIDYKPIFVNDKENQVAFIVSNNREYKGDLISVDIGIVFSLKLTDLTDSEQREDEKAILTALKITDMLHGESGGIKIGLPKILEGFDVGKERDMQPWLNFSISKKISYKNTIGCNTL